MKHLTSLSVCFLSLLSLGLILDSQVIGQSLVSTNGEVVAATGLPVPGLVGVTYGGDFEDACIDSQGRVAFVSGLSGSGVSANNGRACLFGQPSVDLSVQVRAGDPVPGLPGVSLGTEVGRYNLGGVLRLSGNGNSLLVTSNLVGAGVSSTNDGILYGGSNGSLDVLVREGESAPGPGPGIFGAGLDTAWHGRAFIDDSGRIMIGSSINFGVNPTYVNFGICAGAPGALALVQRVGGTAFGANVEYMGVFGSANQAGQIFYRTVLSRFVGTTPATSTDDEIIWRWTPGVGNEVLVRESDPVVAIPGAVFGRSTTSGFVTSFDSTTGPTGDTALRLTFIGGGAITGVDDEGIFLGQPGSLNLAIRNGDPIAGTGLSIRFPVSSEARLQSNGDIIFLAELLGPGVTAGNNTAFCRWSNGVTSILVREGTPVVGTVGAMIANLNNVRFQSNDRGQLLMNAPLFGGDTTPGNSGNSSALIAIDPELGMILVLRQSDTINLPTGMTHQPWLIWANTDRTGDGGSAGLNHNGDVVIRSLSTFLPSRTWAIFRTHIGSLWATPRSLSQTSGGTQTFTLNGGSSRAGQSYLLAGTVSGSSPGISIGSFTIPLNPDPYFSFSVGIPNLSPFNNTAGVLDARGLATASITIPPGLIGLAGLNFHHAFVTVDGSGLIDFVSETAELSITP